MCLGLSPHLKRPDGSLMTITDFGYPTREEDNEYDHFFVASPAVCFINFVLFYYKICHTVFCLLLKVVGSSVCQFYRQLGDLRPRDRSRFDRRALSHRVRAEVAELQYPIRVLPRLRRSTTLPRPCVHIF